LVGGLRQASGERVHAPCITMTSSLSQQKIGYLFVFERLKNTKSRMRKDGARVHWTI
jgi:hypothetical protein